MSYFMTTLWMAKAELRVVIIVWSHPQGVGALPTMSVPDARRSPALNEIAPDLSVAVAPRDSCTQIERYPTVRYGPA
jgi:hypothetical protein